MALEGGALKPPNGGTVGQPSSPARGARKAAVARMAADLAALSHLTSAELAQKYLELFGQAARTRNKGYLRKRLAWRIQELAEGCLSDRALARIEELGAEAMVWWNRPTVLQETILFLESVDSAEALHERSLRTTSRLRS